MSIAKLSMTIIEREQGGREYDQVPTLRSQAQTISSILSLHSGEPLLMPAVLPLETTILSHMQACGEGPGEHRGLTEKQVVLSVRLLHWNGRQLCYMRRLSLRALWP